jgi:hypothetical protein
LLVAKSQGLTGSSQLVFVTQGVDHRTPLEQPRRSRRWNSMFCRIE